MAGTCVVVGVAAAGDFVVEDAAPMFTLAELQAVQLRAHLLVSEQRRLDAERRANELVMAEVRRAMAVGRPAWWDAFGLPQGCESLAVHSPWSPGHRPGTMKDTASELPIPDDGHSVPRLSPRHSDHIVATATPCGNQAEMLWDNGMYV